MRFYCGHCKSFSRSYEQFRLYHQAHMPKTGLSGWRSAFDGASGVTVQP